MPNHDRFECQTMIDSDAILQSAQCDRCDQCNSTRRISIQHDGVRFMRAVRAEIRNWAGNGTVVLKKILQRG